MSDGNVYDIISRLRAGLTYPPASHPVEGDPAAELRGFVLDRIRSGMGQWTHTELAAARADNGQPLDEAIADAVAGLFETAEWEPWCMLDLEDGRHIRLRGNSTHGFPVTHWRLAARTAGVPSTQPGMRDV
jgi:hypothetical protein